MGFCLDIVHCIHLLTSLCTDVLSITCPTHHVVLGDLKSRHCLDCAIMLFHVQTDLNLPGCLYIVKPADIALRWSDCNVLASEDLEQFK